MITGPFIFFVNAHVNLGLLEFTYINKVQSFVYLSKPKLKCEFTKN